MIFHCCCNINLDYIWVSGWHVENSNENIEKKTFFRPKGYICITNYTHVFHTIRDDYKLIKIQKRNNVFKVQVDFGLVHSFSILFILQLAGLLKTTINKNTLLYENWFRVWCVNMLLIITFVIIVVALPSTDHIMLAIFLCSTGAINMFACCSSCRVVFSLVRIQCFLLIFFLY